MTATTALRDQLIEAHPQAATIRRVLDSAYRAYSLTHKTGLDALSWLLGPAAPLGFAMVNDHREQQHDDCAAAIEELLAQLGHSVADRRILALLLDDYPGRNARIACRIRQHLEQAS